MSDFDHNPAEPTENGASGSMKSNIAMLLFGLVTLFYLVAIDHEEWFHMRPISGVAMALSQASDDGGAEAGAQR